MCADFADEDNCKIPNFLNLFSHALIASIMSGTVIVGGEMLSKRYQNEGDIGPENVSVHKRSCKITTYRYLRKTEHISMIIQDFMLYISSTKNVIVQRKLCYKIFKAEVNLQNKEGDVHIFILQQMGTNDSIGRFYDLLNKSISVKVELFISKKMSLLFKVVTNSYISMTRDIITSLFRVAIYYTDIYKDIYLAVIIYRQVIAHPNGLILSGESSFPTIIFINVILSVCVTETCNLFVLITNPHFATWNKAKMILAAIFVPFIQAYLEFNILFHELNMFRVVNIFKENEFDQNIPSWERHKRVMLSKTKNTIFRLNSLIQDLKATENSFEHFHQLLLLMVIILFSKTSTQLFLGFNKVFIDERSDLIYLSVLLSFGSLVNGPLGHLSSRKNGFIGIVATLILAPYFAIGSMTRLFMVLMIFTPFIGLFDTMHYYTKGKMRMPPENQWFLYKPESNLSYYDLWEENYRIKKCSDFFCIPSNVGIGIILGFLILHLIVSFFLLLPFNKTGRRKLKQIIQGIWTLISVPLFCDWEYLYRQSNFTKSVTRCWKESMKVFLMFQCIFVMEHLVALTPLIWLKIAVDQRHAKLEQGIFKPVPDEILSRYMVNMLLILGVVVTFVSSLLQSALAYLYFRYGHPWAIVLKNEVFSQKTTPGDNDNSEFSQGDGQINVFAMEERCHNNISHVENGNSGKVCK